MSAAETPSADPMDLAVCAALRGVRGANPLVGAVLTDEAGRVLAVGHHRGRGTAHAEVDALTRWRAARAADPALATLDPAGLTLHVTLEPCDHTGSTGPCSQAVLDAGIGALRYAVADPTGHDGGGEHQARRHEVSGPVGQLLGRQHERDGDQQAGHHGAPPAAGQREPGTRAARTCDGGDGHGGLRSSGAGRCQKADGRAV